MYKACKYCDGCGKYRKDVKSVGKDANGCSDYLCFICRVESSKGKRFDSKQDKYVYADLQE